MLLLQQSLNEMKQMKGRTSFLNPYAATYVSLCRKGVVDESTKKGYTNGYQASTQSQYRIYNGSDKPQIAEDSKLKCETFYGSLSQNPNEVTEKKALDEEYDMDLAYLLMMFPGISDESLSDVYKANNGDLEATVDMLSELEVRLVKLLSVNVR